MQWVENHICPPNMNRKLQTPQTNVTPALFRSSGLKPNITTKMYHVCLLYWFPHARIIGYMSGMDLFSGRYRFHSIVIKKYNNIKMTILYLDSQHARLFHEWYPHKHLFLPSTTQGWGIHDTYIIYLLQAGCIVLAEKVGFALFAIMLLKCSAYLHTMSSHTPE